MPYHDRRHFVRQISWGLIGIFCERLPFSRIFAATNAPAVQPYVMGNFADDPANFAAIFRDPHLKSEFFLFLQNIYHLYPEERFLTLIEQITAEKKTDAEIYAEILRKIGSITPFFSEITYGIPALTKQKKEIADQTMQLLNTKDNITGYLEIGTPGRYISELKKRIDVRGDIALVNLASPSFSPVDILERGQLTKLGRYIPLSDYAPISDEYAADSSFEVVANYIGFHHSSLAALHDFVVSIHRVLKPGGTFILRDHDVLDEKMNHMVALAHDVFNAGLLIPWAANHAEVRNFRALDDWIAFLGERGLDYQGRKIFQDGDPTRNALMEFRKV